MYIHSKNAITSVILDKNVLIPTCVTPAACV